MRATALYDFAVRPRVAGRRMAAQARRLATARVKCCQLSQKKIARAREQYQQQGHIPVATLTALSGHRHGMLDIVAGQHAWPLARVDDMLRMIVFERF